MASQINKSLDDLATPLPPFTSSGPRKAGAEIIPKELLAQIVSATEQLFGGPVGTEVSFDPSEPDDRFLVFAVEAGGTFQQRLALRYRWFDEIARIAPDVANRVCLSVVPK